jgi:hypothetical protein
MNANEQIIQKFYTAFQQTDFRGMQQCYADDISFSDNAFPNLKGGSAKAMWHMLADGSKDLKLTFNNIKANETEGSCDWEATYTFSLTGNMVINKIHADFVFGNGKIVKHHDEFDFWKWASQAFGLTGKILGWTSFFKHKVQASANERLQAFIQKNPEYK